VDKVTTLLNKAIAKANEAGKATTLDEMIAALHEARNYLLVASNNLRDTMTNGAFHLSPFFSSSSLSPASDLTRKIWENYPMLQRSYLGEPEYISPRCAPCYEKAEKARERKKERASI